MSFHFAANDSQLYVSLKSSISGDLSRAPSTLKPCARDIDDEWMLCNKLKLNDDKTDMLIFDAKHRSVLSALSVPAYVLPHFDTLTHLVIRVSSAFIFQTFAEVRYSVFVNRPSFKSVLNFRQAYLIKSLLKVYYRSVFNESSKTFIFQKCAENLHHE